MVSIGWVIFLGWVILSIFCGIKQWQACKYTYDEPEIITVLAVLFSPIWIVVAFVRQMIFEAWK